MNKRLRIIGLTGAYASGKSAAASIFKNLGACIIDADQLAREIVLKDSPALKEIISEFGKDILLADGSLNRSKLGEIIFNDDAARKKLEKITHPKIRQLFCEKLKNAAQTINSTGLIIYVVPLLFESENKYPELEKIIVISADEKISIERIMNREGIERTLAEKKYYSQIPIGEKEKKADFVIKNNSDLNALEKSVRDVFNKLIA